MPKSAKPKTAKRKELTPTMIGKLQPDPAKPRQQFMDTLVPGFGIRFSGKTKSFILHTRYPGSDSPTRREIGRVGVMSLADAREKARKWKALIAVGIDPAQQEEKERAERIRQQKVTFAAVVEDFIREKLPEERKGKDVEREIRRDLLPVWKSKPITEITDMDVIAVISRKAPDGRVGARNLFALVKRFFRWAVDKRIYGIAESPCATLSAKAILGGEVTTSRDRVLSDDEIRAFWRATGRMVYPVGPAYRLLMLTALRLREAVDVERGELDLKNGEWTIPALRMKGKKSGKKQARAHLVPLTDETMSLFASLPEVKGPYLFSTTGGSRPVSFGTKVKAELDELMLQELRAIKGDPLSTLPHFVNHDIRRTVRTHLAKIKIAEEAREALMAHRPPGIRGTYNLHEYADEKKEALQLWAARLRSIVEPAPSNVVALRGAS